MTDKRELAQKILDQWLDTWPDNAEPSHSDILDMLEIAIDAGQGLAGLVINRSVSAEISDEAKEVLRKTLC